MLKHFKMLLPQLKNPQMKTIFKHQKLLNCTIENNFQLKNTIKQQVQQNYLKTTSMRFEKIQIKFFINMNVVIIGSK